ncbi:preprotein translocase subunit SecA [Ramlibacter sp. MMS24-I3-19]|uniref:preprotein translocase subunit SecA n=1 Tax=Ramlibacter sp. MMS24-I3-19 TaxID=3416606 RepID=UPI003D0619A0
MTSAAAAWPFPGLVWGPYPQLRLPLRDVRRPARLGARALAAEARALHVQLKEQIEVERTVDALRQVPHARRDDAWLRQALRVAAAAMEQALGVRAYWQQLMAARALLDQRLAEMDTGEGKTVAIALAAAVGALAGTPVHVVTANDYLAGRDAVELRGFYARLGLTVSSIAQPMEMAQRRAAYPCDVTYCTAKELAFDYLRDSLLQPTDLSPIERRLRQDGAAGSQQPVLRGLCMAILDEADTILIDEARVPLVLSQAAPPVAEQAFLRRALMLAHRMRERRDYVVEAGSVRLTDAGLAQLATWPEDPHPLLGHPQHRAAALEMAVTAVARLARDRDYVVRDGEVQLVDENTGRTSPGRAWSRGLHQLVELKEGVPLTRRNATLTQVTFQRFFIRYLRLAGISGTLRGAGAELRAVYGLRTVRVPPRTPRQVRHEPTRLLADSATLWQEVAARAADLCGAGRAVLVGTESVQQSDALADVLRARGLDPVVLNARQDQEESDVIGAAGRSGRLTVATSMAAAARTSTSRPRSWPPAACT